MVTAYKNEAEDLARKLGLQDVFFFINGDATHLPLEDETFDVIVMNDFMEHVDKPDVMLSEAFRLLKRGGRIYANFPPYYHPFGAHLSDVINIPWVHLFFSEKTLIATYKQLTKSLPDAEARINLRISKNDDGGEYFSYVNGMTLKKIHKLLETLTLTPTYYKEIPLRPFLKILTHTPLKELFVKMVICVLEKPHDA